jgi:hypothetical protein
MVCESVQKLDFISYSNKVLVKDLQTLLCEELAQTAI